MRIGLRIQINSQYRQLGGLERDQTFKRFIDRCGERLGNLSGQ